MPQLINLNNTIVKLRDLKAITVSSYTLGRVSTSRVVFHLKTRKEYVFNPNRHEWELEEFNETVEMDCGSHQAAVDYQELMMEEWEATLDLDDLGV